MKPTWMPSAITLVLALLTGGRDLAAQEKPAAKRGSVKAVVVDKGPAIDGTLKSEIWQKAPVLELGECTSDKPGPAKTSARVLFDATTLYVAFECAESDTGALAADTADRDGDVWKDDCVELFVSGDMRQGYYHFAINPKGVFLDARCREPKKDEASWNSTAAVKAAIDKNKGWTVTLSVPLKELGAYVGDNQTWTMNLNRTRPARGGEAVAEWSWAIMSGTDFHSVNEFGSVTGLNIAKRDDGVTREAAPAPPAPKTDQGEQVGGVTVYKKSAELKIPETNDGCAKAIDFNILSAKGLKVAFLARGEGGAKELPLNMSDKKSNDNTTSKSYRTVGPSWKPILYYVDRFRYNGGDPNGTIKSDCQFTNIRFHGNKTEAGKALLEFRDFCIYRGEDAAAPEAPADLSAKAEDNGVKLTWTAAKDNVGVGLYAISRAGADGKFAKVAESGLPEYTDKPDKAGDYKYRVLAVDFQDNLGPWSKDAAVKVAKGFEPASQPGVVSDRAGYAENVAKIHKAGAGKVKKGLVLCFGDSITGATMYRVFVESSLGRYRVEANGRAGWTTDGCRKVIDGDLKSVNPEFCLIMLGTNNNKGENALPQAMDDLLAMAKSCADVGTVPIITTIPPRNFNDPESKPEAGYNAQVIKTCRENKIPLAYVFEAFQAGGDRKKLLAGDGVHLMDGGWAVTGPAWEQALNQVNFVLLDRAE